MSNADTLRRIYALMDDKKTTPIRDLLAPGFTAVMPGGPAMTADEWEAMGQTWYAAFGDLTHTIDDILEVGDRVVLRGRFAGTHTGEFMGILPTGKQVTMTFMNFDRFDGDKLVEHRAEADVVGLMQQLGAIPVVTAGPITRRGRRMNRRLAALIAAIALMLIGQTVTATADEHGGLPEHPHVLVLDAQVDFSGEEPVLLDARKCVDLAGNLPLPLRAHHTNVHFGPAGEALLTDAGHVVAPTAPFPGVPWTDCESFLEFFGVD